MYYLVRVIKKIHNPKIRLLINVLIVAAVVSILFVIKIKFNNLLIAENGDTYDFFQMAQDIRSGKLPDSKRMILFPLILSLTDKTHFVVWGRFITTVFYFSSILVIFLIVKKLTNNKMISLCAAVVYAFNTLILDNCFYIMSDPLSTLLILLFFYFSIKDQKKYILLSILAGLAFFTRLENIILFGALGLHLLLIKDRKNLIKAILTGSVFVLLLLIMNYLKFENPLFIAYTQDQAGFNLNIKNLYLGFTNLLFTFGGIWFLPLFIESIKGVKFNKEFFLNAGKSIPLVTTILLSIVLIIWGPFIRLYSVLVSAFIIWIFYYLNAVYNEQIKFRKIQVALLVISLILFLVATQIFGNQDYGMFKLSKGVNILLSLVVFYLLFLSKKNIKNILIPITVLICVINLTIFVERFNVARYKYATIKEACDYYLANLKTKGSIGYMDESGLEGWYLDDKSGTFNYINFRQSLSYWISKNSIKYILYTDEMGHVEENVKPYRGYIRTLTILKEFKSPFPGGYSKILILN